MATAAAAVLGAVLVFFGSACQMGDGSCLRMSECATGYTCVEGTCRSDTASDSPSLAPGDASSEATAAMPRASSDATAPTPTSPSDASTDTGTVADAGPDSSDAASGDAASDASTTDASDDAGDAAPDA